MEKYSPENARFRTIWWCPTMPYRVFISKSHAEGSKLYNV